MTQDELKSLVQDIVAQARQLTARYTDEGNAPVNYACIFAQRQVEYDELVGLASTLARAPIWRLLNSLIRLSMCLPTTPIRRSQKF